MMLNTFFSTNFLNFQVVLQEKKSLSTYKQMWGMYLDLEATAHFLLYFLTVTTKNWVIILINSEGVTRSPHFQSSPTQVHPL